jgi:hypothetical protein
MLITHLYNPYELITFKLSKDVINKKDLLRILSKTIEFYY